MKQYIISVVSAALICSVLSGILAGSTYSKIIKLCCGIFLSIQIMRPIPGLARIRLEDLAPVRLLDSEAFIEEGQEIAEHAKQTVISDETEAYIKIKAASLDSDFSIQVILSEDPVPIPKSVMIEGNLTEEEKQYLQTILEDDLNIAKENQTWIGGT